MLGDNPALDPLRSQLLTPQTNLSGWISDNRFFQNKSEALLYATEYNTDISYYYNDHVFDQVNWGICPEQSLGALYEQRAREIRDNYDYVVLLFSGGSDSTNVLRTFLDNQIPVDEIISYGAWNHVIDKMDVCNIEITVAAAPLIAEVRKTQCKVTHLNLFDWWDRCYQDETWIFRSDTTLAFYTDLVNNALFDLPWLKQIRDQGKKVCFVWGLEKPKLVVHRDSYWLAFEDQLLSSNIYSHSLQDGFAHENFYSHVTCSTLICKQAHSYLNYLEQRLSPHQITNFLMSQDSESQNLKLMRQVLYPHTWDESTFSVGKPKNSRFSIKWHTVYERMRNSTQMKYWQTGIEEITKNIDPKYIDIKERYKRIFKMYRVKSLPISQTIQRLID
jgi:hypothetical protein